VRWWLGVLTKRNIGPLTPRSDKTIRYQVDQEILEVPRKSAPVSFATCVSTDDPRLKGKIEAKCPAVKFRD